MTRGIGHPCKGGWHAHCYKQSSLDRFPVLRASDLDDAMVDPDDFEEEEDQLRFREARDGDHYMIPFQCDTCQFVNIRKRSPHDQEEDRLMLMCIRRAILDSFWSRERSTVSKNLVELKLYAEISATLGNPSPFPSRGPFPVRDADGMEVACNMLIRSLRPGRNAATVQFETIRKGRSMMSNYIHASAGGVGQVALSLGDRTGSVDSSSPTNSFWFRRFLSGCHRRMGDVWIPDRALTIDEVLHAQIVLEDDWQSQQNNVEALLPIALTGALLMASVGAGLRGEELPQIDLGGLRKHWYEGTAHPRTEHVPLVLKGRFKQTVGEKLYFQPLAVRSRSGLEYRLWIHRTIVIYNHFGVTKGPIFRTVSARTQKVKRATIGDLDLLLHDVLKRVQVRYPHILPKSVNVEEEISARRSPRRTFTTQAQNAGLPKEVIEANNRWRKHMRSRGGLPSMDMIERYSDAKASVEYLVRPSAAL